MLRNGRAGRLPRFLTVFGPVLGLLVCVLGWPGMAGADGDDDALVEFHFKPVPETQIAVWLELPDGTFVQDVFVTQATGKLGIGNRPGRWDFLSSWHAPYGPRPSVLPIWAHHRGKRYPKLVFHDDDPADQESLGWHESTSSDETYFCRPLTPTQDEQIRQADALTCPSPTAFHSDKGRFADADGSVYPPRNDLIAWDEARDSVDVQMFSALNDLDSVTGPTPPAMEPYLVTARIPAEFVSETLVAWIEVSLEHDENGSYSFDRENDHFVDPRLEAYGTEYLGQPSVVYRVEFVPEETGFQGTSDFSGYGDWDGASGTVHPPDETISVTDGSGADRLQVYTLNDSTFRFGVFSHGVGAVPPDPGDGDGDGDSSGDGDGDGDGDGWVGCQDEDLPSVVDLQLEAMDFDHVRLSFTIPELPDGSELRSIEVHHRTGDMPLTDENLDSAYVNSFNGGQFVPGEVAVVEVDQLWGNFTYQLGVTIDDRCDNRSPVVADEIQTPAQKFSQIESFCFVATAAYGAPWTFEVKALRWIRDAYLRQSSFGSAFVAFYYHHGPTLAKMIASAPAARSAVRFVLQPVADTARVLTTRR